MASPALHPTAGYHAYRGDDANFEFDYGLEAPSERMSGLRRRRRLRRVFAGLTALTILGGGAYISTNDPDAWVRWAYGQAQSLATAAEGMIGSLYARLDPQPIATAPQIAAEASMKPDAFEQPAPMPQINIREVPTGAVQGELVAPPAGAAGEDNQPVAPLPPPKVDPADPLQKRALAAGLHPELSRVLLERLTDADWRNAATAIRTALAEAAAGKDFVYPVRPRPDQALFKVRFVRGLSDTCRRYVVAITKDGWLTTALPLEKCGAALAKAKQG